MKAVSRARTQLRYPIALNSAGLVPPPPPLLPVRVTVLLAAARDAGKEAGILLRRLDDLARHVELGFRFIGVGSDSAWIVDGAAATTTAARGLRERLA